MEVNVRQRDKGEVGETKVGSCFHVINSSDYFMRIDLSVNPIFKDLLVDTVIYAVNLFTGEVVSFNKDIVVEWIELEVEEE